MKKRGEGQVRGRKEHKKGKYRKKSGRGGEGDEEKWREGRAKVLPEETRTTFSLLFPVSSALLLPVLPPVSLPFLSPSTLYGPG